MEEISEQEARAFVGPRADYYLEKWAKPWSFNWAAVLLTLVWLAHRKMYVAMTILLALLAIETIMVDIVFADLIAGDDALRMFDRALVIGVPVYCGFRGNAWYAGHVQRAIHRLRAEDMSENVYLQALARRGGTNPVASLSLLVLQIAIAGVKMAHHLSTS